MIRRHTARRQILLVPGAAALTVAIAATMLVATKCLAGTGAIMPTTTHGAASGLPSAPATGSGSVTAAPSAAGPSSMGRPNLPTTTNSASQIQTSLPTLRGTPQSVPAPQDGSNDLPLRGLQLDQSGSLHMIGGASRSGAEIPGRVDQFFQLNPTAADANLARAMQSSGEEKRSAEHGSKKSSVLRALWHTLDNAGVPLPQRSDGLDPSLRNNANTQPDHATKDKTDGIVTNSGATDVPPALHKIPQSELEGTDYSMKPDAPNTVP